MTKKLKIKIKTKVHGSVETIWGRFNQDLFKVLRPPLMRIETHQFDGKDVGNEIHLTLHHNGLSQKWVSLISESVADPNYSYFTDVGKELPFPFKSWKHEHGVKKLSENESLIIDEIHFSTGFSLLSYLFYPVLLFQFLTRKPQYKRYFKV
ncbi:MAG: ligand-binding SRPBCC domain-containing protein [Thermoproteota archaeon]|jgi:ligand-binding SRPBCC domain-containing protein